MTKPNGSNEFETIINATPDANGLIECPVIPLRGAVVYPHVVMPITITTPGSLAAVQFALTNHKTVIGLA
ncbi:MAG: LON peptidase substrate-binding domain-containing protein, partial [Anaerolineae bacterium]|nr:LON peptidase substrate-binding domain-containing protein [Anaerolineae bacterium]